MKKELIQSIKIIALSLFIGLGVSIAYATWEEPLSFAPTNNAESPINVGITDQVKNAGLSVNSFIAFLNSEFVQGVKITSLSASSETGESRMLCVDKQGNVKVCDKSILNAVWGQTIYTPPEHENYRIVANLSGGTPPYSCTWSPVFNPGQNPTSCYTDLGIIPYSGVHISFSVHDSSNPQQTRNLSGWFYPSH